MDVRNMLSTFMKESGKSQRQISKETGLSTSVISQYLDNSYTGNNDKVENTIIQYLSVSKERLNGFQTSQFYKDLYNTKEVLFTCSHAHIKNDITLVCGAAGAGKTTALEYYCKNNPGVIMVTANSCASSATAILSLIVEKLGKKVTYSRSALMKELIEQLSDTNRLIIIDEADHLTLNALQAIRNLNDQAKVGIVLSGNDKIYNQMLTSKHGYEFDQIRTRIIVRKRVFNDYTVEELNSIFPTLNDECLGFMLELSSEESLRTAIKILEIASEYADEMGRTVTLKDLRATKKQLFGG